MSSDKSIDSISKNKLTDFVVIFGQMRDDYACLEKIYAFYKDRPNTRIILTTWLAKGKKVDGLYGPSQLRLVFGDEVARSIPYHVQGSKFYNFYPGLRARMTLEGEYVTQEEVLSKCQNIILDIETENFNLDFTQPKGDLNSKRLLYKWWRAVRLVDYVCKAHDLLPHNVMLIRTDRMPANPSVFDREIGPKDLYIDKWAELTAGDMMLISTYANIRALANLFSLCELEPERPWIGIHREMNQRVRDLGLNPISDPEFCEVKNFNKIGIFEDVARTYLGDPVNQVHQYVAYSNRFLEAIAHAKTGDTERMSACLGDLAKANYKEDVSVWLCHYFCAYYLNDLEWAAKSITVAILVAVRNSAAFFKKESLRANDTYLVAMFIHAYKKRFEVETVFEDDLFNDNYRLLVRTIEQTKPLMNIQLNDREFDPERFQALIKEIYK